MSSVLSRHGDRGGNLFFTIKCFKALIQLLSKFCKQMSIYWFWQDTGTALKPQLHPLDMSRALHNFCSLCCESRKGIKKIKAQMMTDLIYSLEGLVLWIQKRKMSKYMSKNPTVLPAVRWKWLPESKIARANQTASGFWFMWLLMVAG